MLAIFKYEIHPDIQKITHQSFKGAEVLSCGLDGNGNLSVWALVETEEDPAELSFYCVGTGWDLTHLLPDEVDINFVGSVTQGGYVWHVFQEVNE